MEKCEYKEVHTNDDIEKKLNATGNSHKPLMRQCMISCGFWCCYFIQGLYLGAPTVLVAQIRREANSTGAVTDEMSSWLSSMPVICASPFVLILPGLLYLIGRKYTYLIVGVCAVICCTFFYCSTNLYHVLIGQAFLSTSFAAVNTFVPVIMSEYTSPKYRGIFLTFKSASTFWGIWVSNAIGTFFYWKNIALVGFLCSSYLLTVLAWPESPYWLAMKGRYAECAKSLRWLKGTNENSEKEIDRLVSAWKDSRNSPLKLDNNDFRCLAFLSNVWTTMRSRCFYKPALISIILLSQYHLSGKLVISVYAIEVLKSLTQDESVAYRAMLILDGVTVCSMYIGCILSWYFKRRTLLFTFTFTGISFLFMLSLYTYLVSLSLLYENHVIIIVLLTGFSIAIGCGPMILTTSIYGEIVPSRFKSSVMVISGLWAISLMSTTLKMSPFLFKHLKLHGCFLFFAASSTIVITILYFYLPETKDKTIQEIEEYFSGNMKLKKQRKSLLQVNS